MYPEQVAPSEPLKENPVRKLFSKIKNFLFGGSKKKKIFVLFMLAVLAGSSLYLILRNSKKIIPPGGKTKEEIAVEQVSEGFGRLSVPGREPPFFVLSTRTKSKYGIIPQEIFVLKTVKPVTKEFLSENIKSTVPVSVTGKTPTEFEISLKNPLATDQVLNISLPVSEKENEGHKFDRNYGWTFQTQGKFRVVGTVPGDMKKEIPLNSGIEIKFSQDDFENPAKLVSVEPALEYKTEIHGETFVLVPLKPLSPETIYTVTLKKGLNLKSRNDPLDTDLTFSFQTQQQEKFDNQGKFIYLDLAGNFIQVPTTEAAVVGVYAQNWKNENSVKTKIYKFASGSDFISSRSEIDKAESSWYSYYTDKNKVIADKLSLVATADLKVQNKENVDFLQLPDKLQAGFYLVQFWYDDVHYKELWLQSTNLSAYTSAGRNQTLVWVNNVESHQPADTAVVASPGTGLNAVTNDKGIAVFTTPSAFFGKGRHYLMITASGGNSVYVPVKSLEGESDQTKENRNDYWSYVYHERRLYKPGDSVYFWGVVKKREGNSVPATVTVAIPPRYSSDTSGQGDLASVSVTPDSNGSFLGKVELKNFNTGWYEIVMKVDDVVLGSSNFEVTQYVKPDMKIEVSSSKNAIFAGEKVDFSGTVTFFDGTPVKGVPLKLYSPSAEKNDQTLETDEKGLFKYEYRSRFSGTTEYYPRYEEVTVNPSLSQEAIIEGNGSIRVYGSKLMLDTKNSQDGHNAKIEGTINKVDLSNVNKGTSLDVKGDPVAAKEVKLTITKTWWEVVQKGTYYDFVEKVTRPTYDYKRHDEKITDTKLKSDSVGSFSYNFSLEDEKSYEAVVSLEDDDKREVKSREYFYYYKAFSFYDDKYTVPTLTLESKENTFSVGENFDLAVKFKGENYKDTDQNKFLFIVAKRGTQQAYVEDVPKLTLGFKSEYIPNINVGSVIFTGNYYQIANSYCSWEWGCSYYRYYYEDNYFDSLEIRYRKDDSKLDIKIEPQKAKYEPGEDAEIKVNISKNGAPLDNATVNMVLVDQALEAIGGVIKPSALGSVYKSVPSEIYYSYYSHKSLFAKAPAAEMGGGGGPREIFKDTAYFGEAKTDSAGNANFKFKLSDNITTWNIFVQAVTSNLLAGESEGKLVVTKEFFVTSNFPHEVLLKDKFSVTANSFGTGVDSNQNVAYEFYLNQADKEFGRLSKTGTTSKDIAFPVPQLALGEYKAVLTGKTGNLDDTLIYPVKVIDSRLDFKTDKTFTISASQNSGPLNLTGVQQGKPIRVIITDAGRGQYYYQLNSYCYIYSNRLEKRIAKKKASLILLDRFNDETCEVTAEELAGFQDYDGGLSQITWGSSDLETTVWSVYVDKNLFDKDKTLKYFEEKSQQAQSGTVQKIYAYWGMTLLGKPKINDLKQLAASAVSYEEKMITALSLASAGETETARELYLDILSDYGYSNKPYIRIQREQEELKKAKINDFVKDTSEALLLGSLVDQNYNQGLYYYLRDYQSDAEDVVIDLGKMAFIGQELSKLPDEDTNVSVKTATRELNYNLKKGGNKSFRLLEGEDKSLRINVGTGKAEIKVLYYVTPVELGKIGKDSRLTVKRTYKKATPGEGPLRPGDIMEVTVDFDLDYDKSPKGSYEVTDHLPSGLTYLSNPGLYGFPDPSWVWELRPGIIKYSFYNSPWWQKYGKKKITYYARVAAVGSYVGEPAIIQSQIDLSVINYTQEESVDIKTE